MTSGDEHRIQPTIHVNTRVFVGSMRGVCAVVCSCELNRSSICIDLGIRHAAINPIAAGLSAFSRTAVLIQTTLFDGRT